MQFDKYLSTIFLTEKTQNIYESKEMPKSLFSKKVKLMTDEHDCLQEETERKRRLFQIKMHTSFEVFLT